MGGWGKRAGGGERGDRVKGAYSKEVKLIKEITRMGIKKKIFVTGRRIGCVSCERTGGV